MNARDILISTVYAAFLLFIAAMALAFFALTHPARAACQHNNDGKIVCRDGSPGAPGAFFRRRAARHVTYLPHPAGCPRRAFCGCGASVRVFGKPVRSLYLARNWFRFPRARCAPGNVAVRRGHVFVIEQCYGDGTVLASDYNSGGHKSRRHRRSLRGFAIVSPTTQTYHARKRQ